MLFRILPGALKTMGRAARADFIVDAPLVSRLHCRLTLDARDGLGVEDLESTNGTWVNGQKVKKAPLMAGDKVKVGRVEFDVRSEPTPA
jgi:pSer/pThr/pTyr-binding forkhead associated (FHA) protein